MTFQQAKQFSFLSQAYPDVDIFSVSTFSGTEGISQLYEFNFTLLCADSEIDLKSMLTNAARFTIHWEEDQALLFHGILSHFEQLQEMNNLTCYEAILVPRLWQANLYQESQLFLDKNVPEILEEILQQAGLTGQDYDLRLTGDYPTWEYICQYQETDFNFISRWMEREGIYYYFEQIDGCEKLIITDSQTAHDRIEHISTISYNARFDSNVQEEIVSSFMCSHKRLPKRVILRDYNYRKPSLEVKGEADVDQQGQGTVYVYGEHFKTPDQGNALAAIRAEALLCLEKIFQGESTAPNMKPGSLFTLEDHYRESFNQEYLITTVSHNGSQSAFLPAESQSTGTQLGAGGQYANSFSCIPANIQFRPGQSSFKPRFYGPINAKVDAAGDGEHAEIDDQGRYKVILPFDQSGRGRGKASRFVRMAQPHSGPGFGMHMPLHKGAEVLLTFIDGDPDRPIISSAVPNPETASPVTSQNLTQNIINTRYGHNFVMDDDPSQTSIRIGTNDGCLIISEDQDHSITLNTPDGYQITLSDAGKAIWASTPGGRTMVLDDENNDIYLWAENSHKHLVLSDAEDIVKLCHNDGHQLQMSPGEINIIDASNSSKQIFTSSYIRLWNGSYNMRIDSGQVKLYNNGDAVRLSGGEIKLVHGSQIKLQVGGSTLTIEGSKISLNAATVEINGGGTTLTVNASGTTASGGNVNLNP